MKGRGACVALLVAMVIVTLAKGGHELAVYPSYYPHEITIVTIAPQRAADLLREKKIQAYIGSRPRFTSALPDFIHTIDSLGSFVTVRVNPQSALVRKGQSACRVAAAVVRGMAGREGGLVFHPYPVTPFHGDYLYHADLADAAKARFSGPSDAASTVFLANLKVKATSELARSLVRPGWLTHAGKWDAEVETIRADDLSATSTVSLNGWLGPPWVRTGWYQAELLLANAAVGAAKERADADFTRLTAGNFNGLVERINLERDLMISLTADCGKIVAGYTVKREYFSAEFSAGLENIGYDSLGGLNSPMFLRTVKLKDFPWNGWLMLGINARPAAAWNPIAGMTDKFGRLMWYAVGDPALLPSPYDSGWMLNRVADVQPGQ
jgi:hypothetical protein